LFSKNKKYGMIKMEDVMKPTEKLRKMLLEEELKLRKKQPEHWAKTKYRKYAKPYTDEELEKIKELDDKRKTDRKEKKATAKQEMKKISNKTKKENTKKSKGKKRTKKQSVKKQAKSKSKKK